MASGPLHLLHFNDVYELEARAIEPVGGAAKFAHLYKELRRSAESKGYAHVGLFSGDCLNPSMLSTVTRGKHMAPVLNELGIAAACLGNHDLDFGLGTFEEVASACNFPWLCSNCDDISDSQPLGNCGSMHVQDIAGWGRVGVVGLIEEAWLATLATMDPSSMEYKDAVATGNTLAAQLRSARGCDVVIALTHMRLPNDELFVVDCVGFDLVLGGHDHEYYCELDAPAGQPALVKSACDFRYLSEILLTRHPPIPSDLPVGSAEPSSPQFMGTKSTPTANGWYVSVVKHEVRQAIPEDPAMAEIVRSFADVLGRKLQQIVGLSRVAMDARFKALRTHETNAGNWVADLMRHACSADIALLNSGTLRADAHLGPGVLRMKDLVSLLPMQDTVVTLAVPGDIILKALENSVSKWPAREGRFAQVSGLRFAFDVSQPPATRVIRSSVLVLHKEHFQQHGPHHQENGGHLPGSGAGSAPICAAPSSSSAVGAGLSASSSHSIEDASPVVTRAEDAEVDDTCPVVADEAAQHVRGLSSGASVPAGGAGSGHPAPPGGKMSRTSTAPASLAEQTQLASAASRMFEHPLGASSITEWKVTALHLPSTHKRVLAPALCCSSSTHEVQVDGGSQEQRGSGARKSASTHDPRDWHSGAQAAEVKGMHAALLRTASNPELIPSPSSIFPSGVVPFNARGAGEKSKGHSTGATLPPPPAGHTWAPLDVTRTYTVATKTYIANGKDGYDCMLDPRVKTLVDDEAGPVLPALVRNHFRILASLSGFSSWGPGKHSSSAAASTPSKLAPLKGSLVRVPSTLQPSGSSPKQSLTSPPRTTPASSTSLTRQFQSMPLSPERIRAPAFATSSTFALGAVREEEEGAGTDSVPATQKTSEEAEATDSSFVIGSPVPDPPSQAAGAAPSTPLAPASTMSTVTADSSVTASTVAGSATEFVPRTRSALSGPSPVSASVQSQGGKGSASVDRGSVRALSRTGGGNGTDKEGSGGDARPLLLDDAPTAAGVRYALAICPLVDGRITILNASPEIMAGLQGP